MIGKQEVGLELETVSVPFRFLFPLQKHPKDHLRGVYPIMEAAGLRELARRGVPQLFLPEPQAGWAGARPERGRTGGRLGSPPRLQEVTRFLEFQSVILPVHDAEPWLDECLRSVLQQDFEGPMELSVFNDASKVQGTFRR